VRRRARGDLAFDEARVDADDVRVAAGQLQDARPAAADQDLRRRRKAVHRARDVRHRVVFTGEAGALVRPHALDDRERLFEAADARARRVIGHAGLVVVGLHPARADAELVAAARQELDRRGTLGVDHRVAVVDVVHERAHAEPRRDCGRGGEQRARVPLRAEVIGAEDRRVAQPLVGPDPFGPGVGGGGFGLHGGGERGGHGRMLHYDSPRMIDTIHAVQTPEGVDLALRVAGPVPRSLAWAVDLGLQLFGLIGVQIAIGVSLGGTGTAVGIYAIAAFLVFWFYPVF